MLLPQHADPVESRTLIAVEGIAQGYSGWYLNSTTRATGFYVVQVRARRSCIDSMHEARTARNQHKRNGFDIRWWRTIQVEDIRIDDWSLLLSCPILIPVKGTRQGCKGAYRTFCFPIHRGEVSLGLVAPTTKSICVYARLYLCFTLYISFKICL